MFPVGFEKEHTMPDLKEGELCLCMVKLNVFPPHNYVAMLIGMRPDDQYMIMMFFLIQATREL